MGECKYIMTSELKKSELSFSADFAKADMPDGSTTAFTRSESRALSQLAANAGRVLTRNQLLDAISEPGSEKSDRNIDFLINRIRRKLGDSAKDPQFIATRYGEGYVWLAKPNHTEVMKKDVYVIIGPVNGTELFKGGADFAHQVVDMFDKELRDFLDPTQNVLVDKKFAQNSDRRHAGQTISISLTFFRESGKIECIVSAQSAPSNRVQYVTRFGVDSYLNDAADLKQKVSQIVPLLLARTWHAETELGTDHVPLPVAMHEARNKQDIADLSWAQNDIRLRALRTDNPDDPAVMLMYATHLHTKYVTLGRELFLKGEENCVADEGEIEQLVLTAIGYAQSRPEMAIMAAKLLYFVDRGYKSLALQLATEALPNCKSVASSLSIVGQLRGFVGETDAAIESLMQAKHLSEKGSHHYLYVLVMLCQIFMATGRLKELATARSELYRASALGAVFFAPLFSDPERPSLRAKGVTLMLGRARAVAILQHIHYVSARLYEQPEHRENAIRTPVNLFVRRFGPDIVPDNIRNDVSGLITVA